MILYNSIKCFDLNLRQQLYWSENRSPKIFFRWLLCNKNNSSGKKQFLLLNLTSIVPCKRKFNKDLYTTLREKCPYSEFFWLVFSRIWNEYGHILRISPYSARTRENTNQKNSEYGHFSPSPSYTIISTHKNSLKNMIFFLFRQNHIYCS